MSRFGIILAVENPFNYLQFATGGLKVDEDVAAFLVAKAVNIPYFSHQMGFEVFRAVCEGREKNVEVDDVVWDFVGLAGLNRAFFAEFLRSV